MNPIFRALLAATGKTGSAAMARQRRALAALAFSLLACPASAGAADIYGRITYTGTPPAEIPITPLKNDPVCGKFYTAMPTTHFYRVGPKGGFGDVVVALTGIKQKTTGANAAPLLIDQKHCEYNPYIAACQTGQKILVRNSDPVLHNVHVTPTNPGNQEQNQAQLAGGPDLAFVLNAPENFVRFKCDVHRWMFAYVSVFDHPYFAVSRSDGGYRIHNVPPGVYTVVARHRKAGALSEKVEVKSNDVRLDFTFPSGTAGALSLVRRPRAEAGGG